MGNQKDCAIERKDAIHCRHNERHYAKELIFLLMVQAVIITPLPSGLRISRDVRRHLHVAFA